MRRPLLAGITFTVALLAASVAVLSRPLPDEASWMLDWTVGSVMFVAPVVCALACWRVRSVATSDSDGRLVRILPGPRRLLVDVVVTVVLPATLAVLGWVVAGRLLLLGDPDPGTWTNLPMVAPAILLLVAAGTVGAAVGWSSTWFAWPVLLAVVTASLVFLPIPWFSHLVRIGGATAPVSGLRLDTSVLAARCVGAVAVAAGSVGLMAATGRRSSLPAAVAVAVAVLGAALPGTALAGTSDYRANPRIRAVECTTSGAPTVCLRPTTRIPPERIRAAIEPYLAVLRRDGLPVPPVFSEGTATDRRAGVFDDTQGGRDLPVEQAVLIALSTPACPGRAANEQVTEARYVLADWTMAAVHPQVRAQLPPDEQRWIVTPEARSWAGRTYRSLVSCRYEDVRLPGPAGG